MKASVLVNNYNYGRYLRQCVASARAQDYHDLEIVVVDDGSTDCSRDVLNEFDADVRVVLQSNRGQMRAITAGLAHCTGEYIFLLDSDDFWPANYVSTAVRGLDRHGRPDLAFSGMTLVDQTGRHPKVTRPITQDADYGYNYVISHYAPYLFLGNLTSSIVIKKTALSSIMTQAKSLADRFVVNADDVIVVGADLLGFRKVFLSDISTFYRVHDASVSMSLARSKQRAYQYVILKSMIFCVLSSPQDRNPYLRSAMPFAEEFESKTNVPLAEALRYTRAVLAHGKSSRLRQTWRIFRHWRMTGATRNRWARLLLKPTGNRPV